MLVDAMAEVIDGGGTKVALKRVDGQVAHERAAEGARGVPLENE